MVVDVDDLNPFRRVVNHRQPAGHSRLAQPAAHRLVTHAIAVLARG